MIETEIVIVNCNSCKKCANQRFLKLNVKDLIKGLHARPSARLTHTAKKYEKIDHCVDAKNLLAVLTLASDVGTVLKLRCRGQDEVKAANAIADIMVEIGISEGLCPDFTAFRRTYTQKNNLDPDAYGYYQLINLDILSAYAAEIKQGRECIGKPGKTNE